MMTPGMLPTSSEAVSDSSKAPQMRWPIVAASTSGTACTRSVPTSSLVDNVGYSIMQRDDHQRAGPDRRHPHDRAADEPDQPASGRAEPGPVPPRRRSRRPAGSG